jgi:Signal transduction histidine kinase
MKNHKIPQIIREAVNTYPGGLCFAMPDGRPILVNQKMNELILALTGHTILNAKSTWQELENLSESSISDQESWSNRMFYSMDDGTVWRFYQELLQDDQQSYLQIEASDVTQLYHLGEELHDTNRRLTKMYQRQQKLLDNIVQMNQEKELVSVKMRIHDELGQCLIATRNAIAKNTIEKNASSLAEEWNDAIYSLRNIPNEKKVSMDPDAELLKVAAMIGCQIDFDGQRPAGHRERYLIDAAIREAVTNAVRHAHADHLYVSISETNLGYHVRITDNGKIQPDTIQEGSGLRALRDKLEREGAQLQIECHDGVALMIDIPCHHKNDKKEEAHDQRTVS